MSKKITFFVFGSNGAPVKQIAVPKFMIFVSVIFVLGAAAALGYGIIDYRNLMKEKADTCELKRLIASQNDVIRLQRKHIQSLADDINKLKDKFIALNGFEKKIRVIANLDHPEARNGLFGIGGSAPEDINPKLDLKQKHNSLIREMHTRVEELDEAMAVQKRSFEDLIKELDDQKNLLACTPAIRPTKGIITSVFGKRKSPFTGMSEFHKGLDIAARKGTPVYATANGRITFTGRKGPLGNVVMIDHGHGMVTKYAHLRKILKKTGDEVKRGEKIGEMGNTGRSTGPHLHYEVHLNGVPVNPKDYILN